MLPYGRLSHRPRVAARFAHVTSGLLLPHRRVRAKLTKTDLTILCSLAAESRDQTKVSLGLLPWKAVQEKVPWGVIVLLGEYKVPLVREGRRVGRFRYSPPEQLV